MAVAPSSSLRWTGSAPCLPASPRQPRSGSTSWPRTFLQHGACTWKVGAAWQQRQAVLHCKRWWGVSSVSSITSVAAHAGLELGVPTWHTVLLCITLAPLALLSHAATKVTHGSWLCDPLPCGRSLLTVCSHPSPHCCGGLPAGHLRVPPGLRGCWRGLQHACAVVIEVSTEERHAQRGTGQQ